MVYAEKTPPQPYFASSNNGFQCRLQRDESLPLFRVGRPLVSSQAALLLQVFQGFRSVLTSFSLAFHKAKAFLSHISSESARILELSRRSQLESIEPLDRHLVRNFQTVSGASDTLKHVYKATLLLSIVPSKSFLKHRLRQ